MSGVGYRLKNVGLGLGLRTVCIYVFEYMLNLFNKLKVIRKIFSGRFLSERFCQWFLICPRYFRPGYFVRGGGLSYTQQLCNFVRYLIYVGLYYLTECRRKLILIKLQIGYI